MYIAKHDKRYLVKIRNRPGWYAAVTEEQWWQIKRGYWDLFYTDRLYIETASRTRKPLDAVCVFVAAVQGEKGIGIVGEVPEGGEKLPP